VTLLNADLTNLTIEQKRELAGILGTFARVQQHSLQAIAASWKDMYGVEAQLATVPDQQLLERYQKVAAILTDSGEVMASTVAYASDMQAIAAPPHDTHAYDTPEVVAERTHATPRQTAPGSPLSRDTARDATARQVRPDRTVSDAWRDDDALSLVSRQLSPGWTSKELAALLRKDQRTAQRRIAQWIEHGWVRELKDEPGRYEVTITEGH
jgi:hypothetical protein